MSDRDMFWLSPHNGAPEVSAWLANLPGRVMVYDTTLRDGEQTVGVSMGIDDKVAIAQALADAGVDRIEAGFASSGPQDKEAVKQIRETVTNADIWGFARCSVKDIKDCLDTGVRSLVLEIPTSPEKMKAWNLDEEVVLQRIREAVTFAGKEGLYAAFFAVDATRAELPFLEKAYRTAVEECGANEAVVVDTLGVATPETMYYLTKKVKSWIDVPLAVHCHNEFGLGLACTLAALKAGADSAHVTVNGLGEKTGNCDLAELAIALHGLYNVETNIKLDKLLACSKLVERVTGIRVSGQKPVVGDLAFARESGLVVAQLLSYAPSVEGYDPAVVGRERDIVLGKKSGRKSVEYALGRIGAPVPAPELVDAMLDQVKQLGAAKKSRVDLEEFKAIAAKIQG